MAFVLDRFRLQAKLIIAFTAVALITLVAASWLAISSARSALENSVTMHLAAVRDAKREAIDSYFKQVANQLTLMSQAEQSLTAYKAFRLGFAEFAAAPQDDAALKRYYHDQFGQNYVKKNNGLRIDAGQLFAQLNSASRAIQTAYIADNEHPLGSKHLLDVASADNRYNRAHSKFHPVMRDLLSRFGFYDIFLIDAHNGDVVYTVFKELDFASNLKQGAYHQSKLAEAYQRAAQLNAGEVYLSDYAPYTPSYDDPAAFIAAPIYDREQLLAVVAIQLPLDKISIVMGSRAGLGSSGESYLVGQDGLLRSDSYRDAARYNVVNVFPD